MKDVAMRERVKRQCSLDERLEALRTAAELGESVADPEAVQAALAIVERAGARLGHGLENTVVALAGATGSGKSSLFNALSGEDLSQVGVLRPTTSRSAASTWGDDASPLLDWLDIPTRHARQRADDLHGLVLLDLPDHDSTTVEHRLEVDRLVDLVDLVVWVLDPQKYADAAVHRRYLTPLGGHGNVLLIAFNQVDRLTMEEQAACLGDLHRILSREGLADVPVLPVSARAGDGVGELRSLLAERVARRMSAVDRLAADVDRAATRLAEGCGSTTANRGVPAQDRSRLLQALAAAAGVDRVATAVGGSYRAEAISRTGWPLTRWLLRLRPDPLRRLHLGRGEATQARTSLPPATPVQASRVATAVRAVVEQRTADLPPEWGEALRAGSAERTAKLPDRLDAAVGRTDVSMGRRPRWWAGFGVLQKVALVAAVVGALWLTALALLSYLRLDELFTPEVNGMPLPTLLLLGGLLAGLLFALLARRLASIGSRRRAANARRRLHRAVEEVAEATVLQPICAAMQQYEDFCAAVARARL